MHTAISALLNLERVWRVVVNRPYFATSRRKDIANPAHSTRSERVLSWSSKDHPIIELSFSSRDVEPRPASTAPILRLARVSVPSFSESVPSVRGDAL